MKYFLDTEFLEGTQRHRKSFLEALFATKIHTPPTIDLISIGIVAEDGREYYAISKDFNLKEAWNRYDWKQKKVNDGIPGAYKVYWIRENVLKPIWIELSLLKDPKFSKKQIEYVWNVLSNRERYIRMKLLLFLYGKTNKQIAEEVKEFCLEVPRIQEHGNPQFYGYYCDYDWVVFCWLFGKMIDLPNGFPMYCIDLKQELDRKASSMTTMEITDAVFGKGYMKHDVYKYADEKYPEFNVTKINSLLSAANYSHPELKQTNEHNALSDARWNYELYKFLNTL